jgi:ribosomal-protein-alanine N-acetyltransferase
MTVREAEEKDILPMAALEKLCFSEPWSAEALRTHAASPLSVTLVLEEEGELFGYVYGSVIPPEGELYRIAIALDARRKGYGAALLTEFLSAVKEKGATAVYLEVRESNAAARALYERFGFALVGIRKNYYRAPLENAAIMLKQGL